MKKKLFSLIALCYLIAGCTNQPPFPSPEIQEPKELPLLSKIHIPQNILFEIEDLGQEQWSAPGEKDYTLYFKKVKIPTYNISIQYMSPTTGVYDEEHAHWVESGMLNPQGRPTVAFPERQDFKEFCPCLFSPITLYQLHGSLDEALVYFEEQDNIKYTYIQELKEDPGYWSRRRGTNSIRGKYMIEKIRLGTIKFYSWDGPTVTERKHFPINGVWQRYVIYNTETPNWIYKIEGYGTDCAGYPNLAIIDIIN